MFARPDKFDHDGDGRPGGSRRKGKRDMGRQPSTGGAKDLAEAVATGADTASGSETTTDNAGLGDAPNQDVLDHGLDPEDPAVTGIPRDERHDSIDRITGTLSNEAVELRREMAEAKAED